VDTGVDGLDPVSSGEDAWCTSEADWWPGATAADADAEAAVDGLPAGCADRPFGWESVDVDAEAEAEIWPPPVASSSAFSSSDNMVFATLVMSFINEISPIYKAGACRVPMMTRDQKEWDGGAHIIHETLATEDVGEKARSILDVRATFVANHLLPILVIDCAEILPDRGAAPPAPRSVGWGDKRCRRTESESTRYASLVHGKR
jgi:hypothetical protein